MKITIAPPELVGDPESNAMMQAFYSRSKRGIASRLEETTLDTTKIKKALNQYYVNYGHDSIGQCGFTTIFIEDVSMPAIKAIQDNDLFNGQESSTRYIDYGSEPRVQVAAEYNSHYQDILAGWIDLYTKVRIDVKAALITKYSEELLGTPPTNTFDQEAWRKEIEKFDKACAVKAFDIAGAFLPAGVLSNTSWTTSLATLNRELMRLAAHPLDEVRSIAFEINRQVKETYPSIWKPLDDVIANCDVNSLAGYYAMTPNYSYEASAASSNSISVKTVPLADLEELALLRPRPRYARLPRDLHNSMVIKTRATLDYRSFRDVQRHRPLHPTIPLLNGIPAAAVECYNPWYANTLDKLGLLRKHEEAMVYLMRHAYMAPGTAVEKQYLYPMGTQVRFTMTGFIGDWLYFCELRTGETVHPTVQLFASGVWDEILAYTPAPFIAVLNPNVKTPADDLVRPSFRRAAQDFQKKES